jgi:MoaA/NifB/PqqE/SkfB family radical SAM enzyme
LWDGERHLSVYSDRVDEIWNCDPMVSLRRDMAAGKEIAGCEYCNRVERLGGRSKRMAENVEWAAKTGGDPLVTVDALVRRSIANRHRMEGPASYQLDVGNLCNLKCRMCNGLSSSRIERDPVQRAWAGEWTEEVGPVDHDRFGGSGHWFQQRDLIVGELLRNPGQLKSLYVLGGEPFLIKEVGDVIEILVGAGAARDITLSFNTNGTIARPRWLPLAGAFKRLNLWLSIDGTGRHYEYIRHPARWSKLVENIAGFRAMPNASLAVSITVQAYNLLHLADLFRYFDFVGLPFGAASLIYPRYLRPTVLPPSVRELASERLRAYARHCDLETHRGTALAIASELEAAGDEIDFPSLRELNLFTNDLDAARGQSLAALEPGLIPLLKDAGVAWSDELVHARPMLRTHP